MVESEFSFTVAEEFISEDCLTDLILQAGKAMLMSKINAMVNYVFDMIK